MFGDLLATRNIATAAKLLSPPLAFDAVGRHLCADAAPDDPTGCDSSAQSSTTPPPTLPVEANKDSEVLSFGGFAGVAAGTVLLLALLAAFTFAFASRSRLLRSFLACFCLQARAGKQTVRRRRRRMPVPARLQFELHDDHSVTLSSDFPSGPHGAGDSDSGSGTGHLRLVNDQAPRPTLIGTGSWAKHESPQPFWSVQRVDWNHWTQHATKPAEIDAALAKTTTTFAVQGSSSALPTAVTGSDRESWFHFGAENGTTTANLTSSAEKRAVQAGLTPNGLQQHLIPYLVKHAANAAAAASASDATPPPAEGSPVPPRPSPLPARFLVQLRSAERAQTCPLQPARQPFISEPPPGSAAGARMTFGRYGADADTLTKQRHVRAATLRGQTPREVLVARAQHRSLLSSSGSTVFLKGAFAATPEPTQAFLSRPAYPACPRASVAGPGGSLGLGFLTGPQAGQEVCAGGGARSTVPEPSGGFRGALLRLLRPEIELDNEPGIGDSMKVRVGARADLVLVSEPAMTLVTNSRS